MLLWLIVFKYPKKHLMMSNKLLNRQKLPWRRLMIQEKFTDHVVNKHQSYSLCWMTSIRLTLCINSVLIGIRPCLSNLLKKVDTKCSKIESRVSSSVIPYKCTKMPVDHSSRGISYFFPCKWLSNFRWLKVLLMRMNGTSSWKEVKFLIEQLRHQNHHLIGFQLKHGTILQS